MEPSKPEQNVETVDVTGVLPPDPDDQNEDRAEWALQTLEFFRSLTRTDPGDAIADLLCDIGHLVDRDPQWAPDGVEVEVWRAASAYEDETRGEGDEEDGKAMGALEATLAHCYESVTARHVREHEFGS